MEFNLNNALLGKQASAPEKYDASLLFRIPRSENRQRYGIEALHLPFIGFDVWHCYEVSFLTANGFPVSRMLKFVVPLQSIFLVESKSMKLYLNSFNMERFEKSISESEKVVLQRIKSDLEDLLEISIALAFLTEKDIQNEPFVFFKDKNIQQLISEQQLQQSEFTHFKEAPDLLTGKPTVIMNEYSFYTDLLRSNCRVTNQPDWGQLYIRIAANYEIDLIGVIAYIVSFRQENHFHEEVVEMIFKRLLDRFSPLKLMVAATYTRRGGIDINPIRSTDADWIDSIMINPFLRTKKSLRQ
jgi:7-cyano-7-deazaguanine reductase